MAGILYGIGVGPGDPELLTLKAVRLIAECEVIAVPGEKAEDSVAFQIARGACPGIGDKILAAVPMPMTKDEERLRDSHEAGANKLAGFLREGKSVAFLTLGDTTVYSTYLYVHSRVLEMGFEAQIVSGIPSFCAVAARLNMSLVEKAQQLHVIPASYQIEEALALPGTKVLMKAGKQMGKVRQKLEEMGASAVMIENCGMPGERIYRSLAEMPEESGYYSLVIVKDKEAAK